MASLPVRGARDVGPQSARLRRALVERFGLLASRYGCEEVEIPLIERRDLYQTSLGSTSDIVSAELFHVSHQQSTSTSSSPENIVLRPEGTAGVVRAFTNDTTLSSRLWYHGAMFRYERPQRLRQRQFTQLGIELLDDTHVLTDLDAISLAHHFLHDIATASDTLPVLLINTLGSPEDRIVYNETLMKWLRPRYSQLSPISQTRVDTGACLRVLDSKLPQDVEATADAPHLQDFVCENEQRRFAHLTMLLADNGIPATHDHTLVRGLDYYTGTAFEFVDASGQAICAGGRYANVLGMHGVGFAAGLERVEALATSAKSDHALKQPHAAVLALTGETYDSPELAKAARVAHRLRHAGVPARTAAVTGRVGKAVGRAVRDGATAVVVIGADEVHAHAAQVKLVASTHDERAPQQLLSDDDAFAAVQRHFAGAQNANRQPPRAEKQPQTLHSI